MTFLLGAAAAALLDWTAVARGKKRAEFVFKPLTLAFLIVAAILIDPASEARRSWFVIALICSLAGDVFLMMPRDLFVFGLGSFLLAHLAYIAGFAVDLADTRALLVAAGVMLVPPAFLGRRIATSAPARLRPPIVAYMLVLSAMVALALASRNPAAAVAGILFYTSDALIGWRRFIAEQPWMPVAIIVTYHLAQAGFVLSLLS